MAEEILFTQEGYDKIVEKHDYLVSVRRHEVTEHLQIARSFGDLSENAEYDAAKEEQAKLEAEIEQLDYQIRNARIVTEEELNLGKVNLGLTVTIKDLETKEVFDYKIVGITESEAKGDKIEVLIESKDATEGQTLRYQIMDIKK